MMNPISSVRARPAGDHVHVDVWVHSASAGTLVVRSDEADELLAVLNAGQNQPPAPVVGGLDECIVQDLVGHLVDHVEGLALQGVEAIDAWNRVRAFLAALVRLGLPPQFADRVRQEARALFAAQRLEEDFHDGGDGPPVDLPRGMDPTRPLAHLSRDWLETVLTRLLLDAAALEAVTAWPYPEQAADAAIAAMGIVAGLRGQLADAKAKIEDLEVTDASHDGEVNRLRSEIDSVEDERDTFESERDDAIAERDKARGVLQDLVDAYAHGEGRGSVDWVDEVHAQALHALGANQASPVLTARGRRYGSVTICRVMIGHPQRYGPTPLDPDDLGRCIRLLDRNPAWRSRLGEVATQYPEWSGLVEQWPALEECYRRELPTGDAPETYALMRAIATAATPAKEHR